MQWGVQMLGLLTQSMLKHDQALLPSVLGLTRDALARLPALSRQLAPASSGVHTLPSSAPDSAATAAAPPPSRASALDPAILAEVMSFLDIMRHQAAGSRKHSVG